MNFLTKTKILLTSLAMLTLVGCQTEEPTLPTEPGLGGIVYSDFTTDLSFEEIYDLAPNEVTKYYDYFKDIPYQFLYKDAENGYSDDDIAGFTMMYWMTNTKNPNLEIGADTQYLNDVALRFFGKTIDDYDTELTKVLDSGKVTSTGWGPASFSYILHDKTTTMDGLVTAEFYIIYDHTLYDFKYMLLQMFTGEFEIFGDIHLAELTFRESTDEYGNMELQFISAKEIGLVEPPYSLYTQ